jgi:hypothetical protein
MRTEPSRPQTIVNQDGAAILNSTTGTVVVLNSTGAFVWQALERGEDPVTIARELARETGMQVEPLERDVRQFVQDLRDRQLLAH